MAPVTEAWAVSWSPDIRGGWDFDKESFSRQLINIDTAFQALLRDKLEERGYPRFMPAFAALISNMPLDGCVEAEQQGYIQIVPHRRDARAKHLVHSALGLEWVKDALEVGHEAEADIARMIGSRKMRQFKKILRDLNSRLQ